MVVSITIKETMKMIFCKEYYDKFLRFTDSKEN